VDSEISGAKVGWKILAAYVDGSSLAPSREQTQCVTGIGRYLNLARKSHNSARRREARPGFVRNVRTYTAMLREKAEENPPIAFICELKKQVRVGLVPRGEGQSAIPDCADAVHGASNPNAAERGFKIWFGTPPLARCAIEGIARHPYSPQFPDCSRPNDEAASVSAGRG